MRVKIFRLALEAYIALRDMGRAEASLVFARDLASKTRSPLCPDIVGVIFTLYNTVCWVYSIKAARSWFHHKILTNRATPGRRYHSQADSSASDCSVQVQRPRRRDDLSSRRGKSKRVMMALTTDSDTEPDSPRGTDRNIRQLRQVSARIYHAPYPNDEKTPSFPPRIARIRDPLP